MMWRSRRYYSLVRIGFGIFFIALFLGCGSDLKKEEAVNTIGTIQPINFLNKEIYLPSNYQKVNLKEIGEMLRQNPNLDPIDRIYYKRAVQFQNSAAAPELFSEKNNKLNSIWFMPGEYIPLSKDMVSQFVNMLEQNFIPDSAVSGIEYERLESKFLTFKSTKAIKVKYEQTAGTKKRYITQYIVTYKFDTFSIIVTNDKNEDHQRILKNFSAL